MFAESCFSEGNLLFDAHPRAYKGFARGGYKQEVAVIQYARAQLLKSHGSTSPTECRGIVRLKPRNRNFGYRLGFVFGSSWEAGHI
jgi:hypothetical protein